ncbi:MAG: lysozyme, partial [Verrucomicrobiaceae bacterium]
MATQLPADFLAFSKQWEGFRDKAYPDPGSRDGTPWTIGYGQTEINGVPVKKGDTISEPVAAS